MRQIKFRAWDGESMHKESFCEHLSGYGCMFHQFTKPVAIMQFTGLKDVNGVEIYEGDIVESDCYSQGAWFGRAQPRTKYVIKYSDYSGRFCFKQTDRQGDSNSMKVIGNIHQSPDLLNG